MFQISETDNRRYSMFLRKQLTDDERHFAAIESKVKQIKPSSKHGREHNSRGRMCRPKQYSDAERQLAAIARKVAMNRDVLYHGTRHAQPILTTGVLFHGEGEGKISFKWKSD